MVITALKIIDEMNEETLICSIAQLTPRHESCVTRWMTIPWRSKQQTHLYHVKYSP